MRPTVLILDDERPQREILSLLLEQEGYEITATGSPLEALQALETGGPFDLIVCDLRMPMMDGIEFLEKARKMRPEQVAIVVTAHGTIPTAVEAMKRGAFHYLTKPLNREEFLLAAERAVNHSRLVAENRLLQSQVREKYRLDRIVANHGSMQEVLKLVEKVAPTNTTVLIHGESGTGKELIARAIHQLSSRAAHPMQAINCAAIPESLLESELFGYEKGAFTGAETSKKGLLELSSGSTLLLDEIGDMEPQLQGKLLRVLQEREVKRLGATEAIPLDVRFISSTNRDLMGMVREGRFREDLYYRLNTFPILIPPLRRRPTDIPQLAEHFLAKSCRSIGKRISRISPAAMKKLTDYPWPGNVRQLESVIERAVILSESETIQEAELPSEVRDHAARAKLSANFELPAEGVDLEELEKQLIVQAMERAGGVIAQAAPLLGLTYRTLQYRLQKHDLSREGEKSDGK